MNDTMSSPAICRKLAAMQQLILDIRPQEAPTVATYVPGPNGEVLAQLRHWIGQPDRPPLYLWGPAGCGKTHLIKALATELGLAYACGAIPRQAGNGIALDDVTRLDEQAQVEAFDAFNRCREKRLSWVASGDDAPAALALRADLQSRLAWGLVLRLWALSDTDKRAALFARTASLGFRLDAVVADYLLAHHSRDLGRLLALIDALDRLSLELKRPVTVPLLKTLLPDQA